MKKVAAGITAFVILTGSGIFLQQTVAQDAPSTSTAQRYLPEYNEKAELLLPKNFEKWVFVGEPLTPNALNNGQASFPEFHMVYIEHGSYDIYQKTVQFPEGTIFLKELHLLLPAENPDGSRTELSGRGFFSGKLNDADVTVKDTKRYADTGVWGYFNFNHHEPKAKPASVRSKDECAFCHMANAKRRSLDAVLSATGSLSQTRIKRPEARHGSLSDAQRIPIFREQQTKQSGER